MKFIGGLFQVILGLFILGFLFGGWGILAVFVIFLFFLANKLFGGVKGNVEDK